MPVTELELPTVSTPRADGLDDADGDALLLQRYFKHGHQPAMDELFRRHAGRVYRLALSYMGSDADAEDIVQASFMEVLRKGNRDIRHVRGWIMRIAVDICRDKLQEEARRRRRQQDVMGAQESPSELNAQKTETIAAALSVVKALPLEYRLPVWLHHLEGLTFKEIGDALSLPENTVRSQAHRGIDRVRESLAAAGFAAVVVPKLLSAAPLAPIPAGLQSALHHLVANAAAAKSSGAAAGAGTIAAKLTAAVATSKIGLFVGLLIGSLLATTLAFHYSRPSETREDASAPAPKPATAPTLPVSKNDDAPDAKTAETILKNEKIARAMVLNYNEAQEVYRRSFPAPDGAKTFADSLKKLGGGGAGKASKPTGLIDQDFIAAECPAGKDPATVTPRYGYLFRVLTAQGVNAVGGKRDYIAAGSMSAYALLAFPQQYGVTGKTCVMSNSAGTIMARDFGNAEATTAFVKQCIEFDPTPEWKRKKDWPAGAVLSKEETQEMEAGVTRAEDALPFKRDLADFEKNLTPDQQKIFARCIDMFFSKYKQVLGLKSRDDAHAYALTRYGRRAIGMSAAEIQGLFQELTALVERESNGVSPEPVKPKDARQPGNGDF